MNLGLCKPTLDRAIEAIKNSDSDEAKALLRLQSEEHVPVHDAYMNWVAAMLTFIYNHHGAEKLNSVLNFTQSAMWEPLFDEFQKLDLKTKVQNICSLWHWHCTTFQIHEDDEKFTFMLEPCGSGMRLERGGGYEGQRAYARVRESHPMTFMETNFPVYSTHCAINNRVLLARGLPIFIVEGWSPARNAAQNACVQYTYKSMDAVPKEHFERVGLVRETQETLDSKQRGGRLFSDIELRALSTPPMDRAIQALDEERPEDAIEICERERNGWPGLHDQYRDWVSLLLIYIRDDLGQERYREAFESTLTYMLESMYRELLESREYNQAVERLAGIWRALGSPFSASDEGEKLALTVTLDGIFSPRFLNKLGNAVSEFRRIHNEIVAPWTASQNWASKSFFPQLELVVHESPESQNFRQFLNKQSL